MLLDIGAKPLYHIGAEISRICRKEGPRPKPKGLGPAPTSKNKFTQEKPVIGAKGPYKGTYMGPEGPY